MPVRKFRDVSEMEDVWYQPGDPALFRAIHNVWSFAYEVCRPAFPPGVYKHRSIEELNAQTERWQEANFRAFQARRAEQTALREADAAAQAALRDTTHAAVEPATIDPLDEPPVTTTDE